MKIKLIRTGGFIPLIKAAEAEINISENEMADLLNAIRHDPDSPRIKDGHCYEIKVGENSTPVDMEKIPGEYKEIFDQMKDDLKIVR